MRARSEVSPALVRLVTTLVASEVERVRAPERASEEAVEQFVGDRPRAPELADRDVLARPRRRARARAGGGRRRSSSRARIRTCRPRTAGARACGRSPSAARGGGAARGRRAVAAARWRRPRSWSSCPGPTRPAPRAHATRRCASCRPACPATRSRSGRSRVADDPLTWSAPATRRCWRPTSPRATRSDPLLAFDDTGAYRLLLPAMSEDPAELQRFYAETVEPLVAYDDQYETDLVTTVEAFLDCDGNVAAAPPSAVHPPAHDPLPARPRARAVRPGRRLDRRAREAEPRPQGDARAGDRGAGGPASRRRRAPGRGRVAADARPMRIGIITGSGTYALPGSIGVAGGGHPVANAIGPAPCRGASPAPTSCTSRATARVTRGSRATSPTRRTSSRCASAGADAILAVTVCGALESELELGSLIVFDDLHFLANRLPDGSICTLHTEPGDARPRALDLRPAVLGAAARRRCWPARARPVTPCATAAATGTSTGRASTPAAEIRDARRPAA